MPGRRAAREANRARHHSGRPPLLRHWLPNSPATKRSSVRPDASLNSTGPVTTRPNPERQAYSDESRRTVTIMHTDLCHSIITKFRQSVRKYCRR
jgi:hypothetical protein